MHRGNGGSDLERFLQVPPRWVSDPGPEAGIVLSSRVRLARNLQSVRFPSRSSADEQGSVVRRLRNAAALTPSLRNSNYYNVGILEADDIHFLVERRLISRDLASGDRNRGVLVGEGETLSIMVNEEDHLRIQGLVSGFRLGQVLESVSEAETLLDGQLTFAFSKDLGFLTACPTNVGTGLRASLLVHLPGLQLTGEARRFQQGANALGLAVRGFYGEGTDMMGNFVQISNQTTLGPNEVEIVRSLEEKVRTVIESEERARETLWNTARIQVEDKVYRALALLEGARTMKTAEMLNYASAVRLGISLGLEGLCSAEALNEILVFGQGGHISRRANRLLGKEERRVLRADYIRSRLALETGRVDPNPDVSPGRSKDKDERDLGN